MPLYFYQPQTWEPDAGELALNPGWVEALNLVPYGDRQWLVPPLFTERKELASADIRGVGIHPSNGASNWMLYYATATKLREVNPSGWVDTDRSGAVSFTPDASVGTKLRAFGPHMIAVNGHTDEPQIQVDGAGNFVDLITNAEPETSTGNWPPKAKHMAIWGPHIAIGNLTDVGPASAFGNTCGFLWWISAAENARTFGTFGNDPGDRTTYDYLADDHGDITGMWGGREFGVIGKTSALYRVTYGGPLLVEIETVAQGIGTIWPNGAVWADDELYMMSTAGPIVMRRDGIEKLGIGTAQRTLWDESWIVTTYTINTDQSAAYLLWATYHQTTDTVFWWYRTDQDTSDRWIAYHRRTNRFSAGQCSNMADNLGTAFTSTMLAAATNPRVETTRFSSAQGLLAIGKDSGGNGTLYEASPTGSVRWVHKPKFTSPWLVLSRDGEGRPQRVSVVSVRPYYSLNASATVAPTLTVTVESKLKPGTTTTSGSSLTVSTEDSDGSYKMPAQEDGLFHRFTLEWGDANVSKIEDLADIFGGIEITYETGSSGI